MSNNTEKKRPYVSSKSLSNLKSIISQNIPVNNNTEKHNECQFTSSQQNDHSDEIEIKRRKQFPNRSVLIEYLRKSDWKRLSHQPSNRRIIITNEQYDEQDLDQSNSNDTTERIIQTSPKRIVIPQTSICDKQPINDEEKVINDRRIFLQSNTRTVICNDWNNEQHSSDTSMNSNEKELILIPELPLSSSMHLFDSSPDRINNVSVSRIDESIPTQTLDSISTNIEDNGTILQEPVMSVNSLLNELNTSSDQIIPCINENSKMESSPNQKMMNDSSQSEFTINKTPIHDQYESIHTTVSQYPLFTSFPSFDCCETYQQKQSTLTENNSNYSRNSINLHEMMINISKRLTKFESLPIVDTHCHFDLIFDRLHIKHNNLKKYFDDYKAFYPSGLLFQLAIQVFWRPRHLTKNNWLNWYSKYLDDDRVYGSCGIHPHWSTAWNETSIEDIERCLKHPKVVAIGEIGLDFGPKNTCKMEEQCRVFEEQLKLASKWLKPVVIHSRNAYQQTFDIMKEHLKPDHKIHLHCFVGTTDNVHLFTSYFTEIKFGFTPIITRGKYLHKVIQQLNLTQILSETDSPYFIPEELVNFSRCAHPGMVYSVVETIAQIRQLSVNDVAYQLRENARYIYGV